jgi:hypothetical protein
MLRIIVLPGSMLSVVILNAIIQGVVMLFAALNLQGDTWAEFST